MLKTIESSLTFLSGVILAQPIEIVILFIIFFGLVCIYFLFSLFRVTKQIINFIRLRKKIIDHLSGENEA